MAIEKVREYLKQFNAADRIVEFTTSSATVELAAEAVGCIPARIAKSLAFQGEDKVIMVVMAAMPRWIMQNTSIPLALRRGCCLWKRQKARWDTL